MKTILNNLEKYLTTEKELRKDYITSCEQKKWNNSEIHLQLFNEKSIKKCEEIIEKKLENDYKDKFYALTYFCIPFLITLWTNNKDKKTIRWDNEQKDLSINDLYKILKDSKKKYLKLCGTMWYTGMLVSIVELEI